MIEIGSRQRSQPAPPHVVFEALRDPERAASRTWLTLRVDEQLPTLARADPPASLVWSSLWAGRPDDLIEFDIRPDGHGGTALRWTLFAAEPPPDAALIGHLRKRMNQLINADLRYSFGQ